MLSPIQRWLANPTTSRWEQPSYDSLKGLASNSAQLRKRQAYTLWHQVFSLRKEVSALAWAKLYASHARLLVDAHRDNFVQVHQLSLEDQWLHCMAYHPSYVKKDSVRHSAGQQSLKLLRALGHEHVLSQALVETVWLASEQIDFWRMAFSDDPMHEHMQVALGVQAVRRQTLDGYLRARKHLSAHEVHDTVDLSILQDE